MSASTAGVLLVAGSIVFFVGAGIGVPGIFREPDRGRRLEMLQRHTVLWRVAQPLYAAGALLTALGVGALGWNMQAATPRILLGVSALALFVGALAWGWCVYARGRWYREFALGSLPSWPFFGYVVLTLTGLGLLGAGLLEAGAGWLGWLTFAADLVFLGAYLRFDDIPPFVFYVLLTVVGAVAL